MSSSYNWYTVRTNREPITQGDILVDCPVFTMVPQETSPFYKVAKAKLMRAVVLSQACDLENEKIDDVAICPVDSLKNTIKELLLIDHEEANKQKINNGAREDQLEPFNFETIGKSKKENKIKEIQRGNLLDIHLINEFKDPIHQNLHMPYQTVALKNTYYVPLKVLNKVYANRDGNRLQLLPPYREHLSQAYARNFMRIGLPNDVRVIYDNL